MIQLNGHPAAVRRVDAESDRAERGGEEGRIHAPRDCGVHVLCVREPGERPETGDVGLGLFNRARGFLELLPHRRRAPADRDVVRPEPVHQLVHQNMREESLEGHPILVGGCERHLRDGREHHPELRLLHVLQHHALAALLLHDTLVIGQVERSRLDAAVRIPRSEDHIDDADGGELAELGGPVPGLDWQRVLQFLQVARERLQLLRLHVVAHGDERFERGLVVEPFVFVHLVRPDGGLDRGVELHPRDVAGVVIVRDERIRPAPQELLEAGLRREVGRLAEKRRRASELPLVLEGVRHGREVAVRSPADCREEPRRLCTGLAFERVDPCLDLFLRSPGGIEVGSLRLCRDPRDKGAVSVEAGPGTLVQQEVVQAGTGFRRRVDEGLARELLEQGVVAGPDLAQEDRVHDACGLDQLCQRAALAGRQRRDVGADVDRRESCCHGLELGRTRSGRAFLHRQASQERRGHGCQRQNGRNQQSRFHVFAKRDRCWRLSRRGTRMNRLYRTQEPHLRIDK